MTGKSGNSEKIGYFDRAIEDLGEDLKDVKQELRRSNDAQQEANRSMRKWALGITIVLTLQLAGIEGPDILGMIIGAAQALPW